MVPAVFKIVRKLWPAHGLNDALLHKPRIAHLHVLELQVGRGVSPRSNGWRDWVCRFAKSLL
jgi:hypothetical protein